MERVVGQIGQLLQIMEEKDIQTVTSLRDYIGYFNLNLVFNPGKQKLIV